MDILSLQPFETCSIRPPTENNSLTFRLTRNCAWNRCMFCPVYKTGAQFSKRSIEEIKEDVRRAVVLDRFLAQEGIGTATTFEGAYSKARTLLSRVPPTISAQENASDSDDEKTNWFSPWFKDKPSLEESIPHLLSWRFEGARTCSS
jgi:hypothetical protein